MEDNLSLCGFSMGGYIAIKLLQKFNVQNLILFCPAVYDKKAQHHYFGEEFTSIIRAKDSWKNSDAFKILEKFTGNLILVKGDKDEVVPADIFEQIAWAAKNANVIEITLQDCTHSINEFLKSHPTELENVVENITQQFVAD